MNEMALRIKELRLAKGWTQEQLGDRVGLQKSAIAKYENGRTENMKRDVIQRMASVFGVRPSYLMGFTDEPYSTHQELIIKLMSELNEEGQEKVLEYARLLMASGEYKKRDSIVVGE